jgi:hypothetical protein
MGEVAPGGAETYRPISITSSVVWLKLLVNNSKHTDLEVEGYYLTKPNNLSLLHDMVSLPLTTCFRFLLVTDSPQLLHIMVRPFLPFLPFPVGDCAVRLRVAARRTGPIRLRVVGPVDDQHDSESSDRRLGLSHHVNLITNFFISRSYFCHRAYHRPAIRSLTVHSTKQQVPHLWKPPRPYHRRHTASHPANFKPPFYLHRHSCALPTYGMSTLILPLATARLDFESPRAALVPIRLRVVGPVDDQKRLRVL